MAKTSKPYSNRTNSYKRNNTKTSTTTTKKKSTTTKKSTTPKKTTTPKKNTTVKKDDLKSKKIKELEVLEKKLEATTRIRVDKERIEDTGSLDTSFLDGNSRSKKNKNILKEEIVSDDFEVVEDEDIIDIPFSDINLEETKEVKKVEKKPTKKKTKKQEMPDFLLDDFKPTNSKLKEDNKTLPIKEEKEERHLIRNTIISILGVCLIVLCVMGMMSLYHVLTTKPEVKYKTKEIVKTKVDDNYLFLGDSITDFYDLDRFYPDMPVVNSGVNANRTTHILDDMYNRVYKYNPSKVFILIGVNDIIDDKDATEITTNIREIVDGIQDNRKYAEIYVESIYPINDTEDEKIDLEMVNASRNNEKIKTINKEIKKMCKEKKITYIDMYSKLVDEDDKLNIDYTTEGLHLNNEGYKVVTEEIMKYIKK